MCVIVCCTAARLDSHIYLETNLYTLSSRLFHLSLTSLHKEK